MAVWQIVMICLGAIIIGVGAGLLIDYLVRRSSRKTVPNSAVAGEAQEVIPVTKKENSKPPATMVPLLSRRSLIVLAIGLIVGAGLGLGYWAISPLNPSIKAGWPPIEFENIQLYESTAYVEVMNPGASTVPLETLRKQAEYFVAKMNTLTFFEFLNQKITAEAPQYYLTTSDLAKAITIEVRYEDVNTTIRVRATSQTPTEAHFLASVTQQSFQEYLTTEELNMEKEAYQSKLSEIESAKTALYEAQKDLSQIVGQVEGLDVTTDPQYIALNARIQALQLELTTAAQKMASLITQGVSGADYTEAVQTVDRASKALGEARQELTVLQAQAAVSYFEQTLAYTEANARVESLSKQLNSLIAGLGSPPNDSTEPTEASYFRAGSEASAPVIVPPERVRGRNAVMMGALFGIAGGWVVLNRRWLTKGLTLSREEDEETEA